MDRDAFWQLIDITRPADNNSDGHAVAIIEQLIEFNPDDIVSFDEHISSIIYELECPNVFAVANIVLELPSDDQFTYFCGWLILQGKQAVVDILHYPSRTAKYFPRGVCAQCELVGAIAMRAYERRVGTWRVPTAFVSLPKPQPILLTEAQIRDRFPELWEKFVIGTDAM